MLFSSNFLFYSILFVDESWDKISEAEEVISSLFKDGRSPASVDETTPAVGADPATVVLDSAPAAAAVTAPKAGAEARLDSGVPKGAVAITEVVAVEDPDDVRRVDDEDDAAVVAAVVLVEVNDNVDVVMGGELLAGVGATTTYEVPNPNKCPQYLLSSISSSKNISFIRKKVWPVNRASEPA